jgi:hypothetical protein
LLCTVLSGCLSDDVGTSSFGVIIGSPEIKFARATSGITNYNGTGYYQWNIILATTDGCAGDTAAKFEINTPLLGSPNAFPLGTIPVRGPQDPIAAPSALAIHDAATGVSGSITIDTVAMFEIRGNFDATMSTGPMTGNFIAFRCEEP